MLSDKEHDENEKKKLNDVLNEAIDIIPHSTGSLWHARINHLLQSGQEKEVDILLPKVINIANNYTVLDDIEMIACYDGKFRRQPKC